MKLLQLCLYNKKSSTKFNDKHVHVLGHIFTDFTMNLNVNELKIPEIIMCISYLVFSAPQIEVPIKL